MKQDRRNLNRKIVSFEECIPNLQHLLVEYFGKLVYREHFEKKNNNEKKFDLFESTLKKDSIFALVLQFLNKEAADKSQPYFVEYSKTFKLFFQNISKLPDVLDKYYNMECEALIDKIDCIRNQKNEISMSTNHSFSHVSIVNVPPEAKDFFDYIDEQVFILDTILSLIRDFADIMLKVRDYSRNKCEAIYPEDLNYYVHVNFLDKNIKQLDDFLNSNDFKYIKNSYDSFLSLLLHDFVLLKSLLSAYKFTVNLDMFLGTLHLISASKTIDQIRGMYHNMGNLRLYNFFLIFYSDNYFKYNLVFEAFLFKKQNNLVLEMSSTFDPSIKIIEEIFKKKESKYEDIFTKKCEELRLDLIHFILVFETKKFFSSVDFEEKTILFKLQYTNNMCYLDSNDEFALVKIFHITSGDNRKILNDLTLLDKKEFFSKHKVGSGIYLLTYPITSYLFISAKYKERNPEELLCLTELMIDLKNRFTNKHVFSEISKI